MFSGLYGDLPSAKGEDTKPSDGPWVGKGLVAPSSLNARRAGPAEATSSAAAAIASAAPLPQGSAPSVADEYDPARPNDYESDVAAQRHAPPAPADERSARLALSGEEAWQKRGAPQRPAWATAQDPGAGAAGPPQGAPPAEKKSLAQKMLEKMGWREGEGLGANRQGISTPLAVQKTDARSGVIVQAAPAGARCAGAAMTEVAGARGLPSAGPATRVVLLKNMVGPGGVDDGLDEEVGEECSKYGTVTSVLIFEVTEPGFPVEEAVRIFIQFSSAGEATQAMLDLNGRFFAGRVVAATFYDETRFGASDLAPSQEELKSLER
ncbi:DNA-damage-repair/toleration protein DRT111, chloroplastic [Auxenochlorella protothecoides]|uniref:DNA-damage-repair/toleration protein DRT111, chloroplastic n=1 Tax=Auxenochlorella protothecoides TaxID=3075 RepID=A0A087SDT8_AUXPR|nr:DNA-damage-repair/toleration protein DRT111, chloroplastic [Auxenochlorella protothecoides]KFM23892.1 DNA-damage-repair/toleration protein DRT111, chloroplastic [Auxenochlorella protothecoides]